MVCTNRTIIREALDRALDDGGSDMLDADLAAPMFDGLAAPFVLG